MVVLASVLTPRCEVVTLGEDGFAEWTPITIHFDGSMEPRNLRGKEDFKGRLFAVYPGDLVFSKIDARNGAIGLLPAASPRAVVTAEYPVYNVDETQVVPEYMALFLQTADFKQSVNDWVSGTSGRKRVQPEAFINLFIPLPPLETQRAIVARWHGAQVEIAAANERIELLETETLANVKHALGRKPATQINVQCIYLEL
jgi:type I restriction enzyme S subunit